MASLTSILILGPDTVAAASPATPVQLVHACRRWGFSSVVPASWGDELIAAHVIRRCATRESRPLIQCSCPRVGERLAAHADLLDDTVIWLLSPPAAVARYLRAQNAAADLHVTYAGGCPGAADTSIDQRITPTELLLAISARGIDIGAQPTVFEDIIPPDRRRHYSGPAGVPEPQQLWEAAAFRIAQPIDGDFATGVAQLLLSDERLLIDPSATLGCICRTAAAADHDGTTTLLRAPSPVVQEGRVDVTRSAPVSVARPVTPPAPPPIAPAEPAARLLAQRDDPSPQPRSSPARPLLRRQSTWRRQTPRPGVVVARTTGAIIAVPDLVPFARRPETRIAIATLVMVATLFVGLWIGRWTAPPSTAGAPVSESSVPPVRTERSRSP